jgi:hypothetical protein
MLKPEVKFNKPFQIISKKEQKMPEESIIDASKPNAGRIYDYVLGGHHNFEVDRQAAEQIIKLLPFTLKAARLQRWCLQDLGVELTEKRGYDIIIDFASGLPTNDHIHQIVPEGTKVIYSDYDPLVVEYAHEILGDTPNVYIFQADARRPEELLNNSKVQEILGDRRDVALIHWGVSVWLSDEDISYIARILYEWAGKDSCWAFHTQAADANPNDPGVIQVQKIYEQMGTPGYPRSLERYKELLQPWRPDEKGFISLLEWHGLDQAEMTEEDQQSWGPTGIGYGAYLIK